MTADARGGGSQAVAANASSGSGPVTGALTRPRKRSAGVRGLAVIAEFAACLDGMPTGAPQRGQTLRRAAISSRARKCLPQLQTNLIDMMHSRNHGLLGAAEPQRRL